MSKFGMVVGVCTDRDADQRSSLDTIATGCRPDTDLVVVFNGVTPFLVHSRYEVVTRAAMIGREQGLWPIIHRTALARGWNWAGTAHDDFYILESGWEAYVERYERELRIGTAGWANWPHVDHGGKTGREPHQLDLPGKLGSCIDGMGMSWNMALYGPRGFFSAGQEACGFGELESIMWGFDQGWGSLRIDLRSTHHPGLTKNSREVTGTGAGDFRKWLDAYEHLLPAEPIDEYRYRLGSQILDVRRTASEEAPT